MPEPRPCFWERFSLAELTREEWELLCDGCGKCCLHKLEDADTGEIHYTNVACRLLDLEKARCGNYPARHRLVADCLQLDADMVEQTKWLPDSCAYRLVAHGQPLPEWHHLISGDREAVHRAGASIRGWTVSEEDIDDDIEDHIVDAAMINGTGHGKASAKPDPLSIRRLYGRASGPALRPRAQQRMAELLPLVAVPEDGPLDATRLFGRDCPLALEIGFGKGDHLAFQARQHPGTGFIGAEPYLNGVARLLEDIDTEALGNIRIHHGDALDVLERLPDASLDMVYLLHPDPWPKARHAKRRFVNPGPIGLVADKLKPGGQLRIATDHPVYLRHSLMVMQQMESFVWDVKSPADWQQIPSDWPDTRFALKARNLGHDVWRLIYIRI